MSVPFTIDQGSWQEKAEELRLAISERFYAKFGVWRKFVYTGGSWRWVNGDGTDADILQGMVNLQASTFWNGLQFMAQSIAVSWVGTDEFGVLIDYSGYELPGLYAHQEDPEEDLWLTFCRMVGGDLYVSDEDYGWPRYDAELAVTSRGLHVTNDYIVAGIIDSLVLVFESCIAFYNPAITGEFASRINKEYYGDDTTGADRDDAWDRAWARLSYQNETTSIIGATALGLVTGSGTSSYAEAHVTLGQRSISYTLPVSNQAVDWSIYLRAAPDNNYQGFGGTNVPAGIVADTVELTEVGIIGDHISDVYGPANTSALVQPPTPGPDPLNFTEYKEEYSFALTSLYNFTNS